MRTARPTQSESGPVAIGSDASGVELEMADEALAAAEAGYPVFDLPEEDLAALSLEEFEQAITPSPVFELFSWPHGGVSGSGKSSARLLAQLHDVGEVA
ncbi:hypothetical protein ACFWIW_13980 [Amycolatopsis sp. NPDC058340]|uniref:hypothetical protein n=1 Tax=Amycolatopsis sp. NPDC058340 TaxID=3346453 RepID=UPI0036552017